MALGGPASYTLAAVGPRMTTQPEKRWQYVGLASAKRRRMSRGSNDLPQIWV
jgi:hypothetical protein